MIEPEEEWIKSIDEIDDMLRNGRVSRVIDFLGVAEEKLKENQARIDDTLASTYSEIVYSVSSVCVLHDISSSLMETFDGVAQTLNELQQEVVTSITHEPESLLTPSQFYVYNSNRECCSKEYEQYLRRFCEWLALPPSWMLCFSLITANRLSKTSSYCTTSTPYEALFLAFLEIPRRVTEHVFFFRSLQAFYLLTVVTPQISSLLSSLCAQHDAQKHTTMLHRHAMYCQSHTFTSLLVDVSKRLLRVPSSNETFPFICGSGSVSIGFCNCGVCRPLRESLACPSLVELLDTLFVMLLCGSLTLEETLTIFEESRDVVTDYLLQSLVAPCEVPRVEGSCALLAQVKSQNLQYGSSPELHPTAADVKNIILAHRISALLHNFSSSIAIPYKLREMYPNCFIKQFSVAFDEQIQDSEHNVKEEDTSGLCSCSICSEGHCPSLFHVWMDGSKTPRPSLTAAPVYVVPNGRFFGKMESSFTNALRSALFSFINESETDATIDCDVVGYMVSLLVMEWKANEVDQMAHHVIYEGAGIMKDKSFGTYTTGNRTTTLSPCERWNAYFSTCDTERFFKQFVCHWKSICVEATERSVPSCLRSILTRTLEASCERDRVYQLLDSMNAFLSFYLRKSYALDPVAFCSHDAVDGMPIRNTDEQCIMSPKQAVAEGILHFISQQAPSVLSSSIGSSSKKQADSRFPLSDAHLFFSLLLLLIKDTDTVRSESHPLLAFLDISECLFNNASTGRLKERFQECCTIVNGLCHDHLNHYWSTLLSSEYHAVQRCVAQSFHMCRRNHSLAFLTQRFADEAPCDVPFSRCPMPDSESLVMYGQQNSTLVLSPGGSHMGGDVAKQEVLAQGEHTVASLNPDNLSATLHRGGLHDFSDTEHVYNAAGSSHNTLQTYGSGVFTQSGHPLSLHNQNKYKVQYGRTPPENKGVASQGGFCDDHTSSIIMESEHYDAAYCDVVVDCKRVISDSRGSQLLTGCDYSPYGGGHGGNTDTGSHDSSASPLQHESLFEDVDTRRSLHDTTHQMGDTRKDDVQVGRRNHERHDVTQDHVVSLGVEEDSSVDSVTVVNARMQSSSFVSMTRGDETSGSRSRTSSALNDSMRHSCVKERYRGSNASTGVKDNAEHKLGEGTRFDRTAMTKSLESIALTGDGVHKSSMATEAIDTEAEAIVTATEVIDVATEAIDTAREGIDATREGIDATREAIDTTREGIDATREAIDTTREAIDTTREAIDVRTEPIDAAREGIDATREGIDATREGIDATREAIDTTREAIDVRTEAIVTAREAIDTTREAIDTTREAIDTTREAIDVRTEAIVTAREGIDATREAIDATREAIDTTREAIDTTREAIDVRTEAIVTAREAIDTTREAIDTTREAIDAAREGIDATREAIDATREAIDATREAIDTTREAIDTTREAIDVRTEAIVTAREAIDTTREAIDTTREAIDTTREAIDTATLSKHCPLPASHFPINTARDSCIKNNTLHARAMLDAVEALTRVGGDVNNGSGVMSPDNRHTVISRDSADVEHAQVRTSPQNLPFPSLHTRPTASDGFEDHRVSTPHSADRSRSPLEGKEMQSAATGDVESGASKGPGTPCTDGTANMFSLPPQSGCPDLCVVQRARPQCVDATDPTTNDMPRQAVNEEQEYGDLLMEHNDAPQNVETDHVFYQRPLESWTVDCRKYGSIRGDDRRSNNNLMCGIRGDRPLTLTTVDCDPIDAEVLGKEPVAAIVSIEESDYVTPLQWATDAINDDVTDSLWFPTEASPSLLYLLYVASRELDHLSTTYVRRFSDTFPKRLIDRLLAQLYTSLFNYLDDCVSTVYRDCFIDNTTVGFRETVDQRCIAQCLFDLSCVTLLDSQNDTPNITETIMLMRDTYFDDAVDQVIYAQDRIRASARTFLKQCDFLLIPLIECPRHLSYEELVGLSVQSTKDTVDCCFVPVSQEVPLISISSAYVPRKTCEDKGRTENASNAERGNPHGLRLCGNSKLTTPPDYQPPPPVSPRVASLDATPYLNVSTLSSFLRGQVEGLSSKVTGVMKQRSTNKP